MRKNFKFPDFQIAFSRKSFRPVLGEFLVTDGGPTEFWLTVSMQNCGDILKKVGPVLHRPMQTSSISNFNHQSSSSWGAWFITGTMADKFSAFILSQRRIEVPFAYHRCIARVLGIPEWIASFHFDVAEVTKHNMTSDANQDTGITGSKLVVPMYANEITNRRNS